MGWKRVVKRGVRVGRKGVIGEEISYIRKRVSRWEKSAMKKREQMRKVVGGDFRKSVDHRRQKDFER